MTYHHLGPYADSDHYGGVPALLPTAPNIIEYLPDFGELQDYE
jgi:hypothetical protein